MWISYTQPPQSPSYHFPWDSTKSLFQIHKSIVQLLLLCLVFLLYLFKMKMASVVPLPGMEPKYMLSNDTWHFILFSNTLSSTLIGCSSNLIVLYELHTSGSHFTLYIGTRILFLQSSGIQPYLTMLLIGSVIHLVPKPPYVFIISLTTPVGPTAFPILIL